MNVPDRSRKRLRPALWSLAFSTAVVLTSLTVALFLFEYDAYMPLTATAVISLSVALFRVRRIRPRLPPPHGSGRASSTDTARSTRQGVTIILLAVLLIFVPYATIFFLPPLVFFALIFGLIAGLPLTELVLFAWVTFLEGRSKGRFYTVSETTEEDGNEVLVKSVVLDPSDT